MSVSRHRRTDVDCRLYGELSFKLKGQAWVDWMIPRVVEACRVTAGLVFVNMAGKVKDFSYGPVVEWLVADLTRQHGIVCGPAPYVFRRVGIPGSGSKHYHRRDWEPVYGFALPSNLPPRWSDNTAMGHPPKWAPGGEMSNRLANGERVNGAGKNQWGHSLESGATVQDLAGGPESERGRRPSHVNAETVRYAKGNRRGNKDRTSPRPDGNTLGYALPVLANPGNVIDRRLTLAELIDILLDYEQTTQATADQVLRDLRQADSAGRLRQWFYGVCFQVAAAALLQPAVLSGVDKATARNSVPDVQQADQTESGRISVGVLGSEVLQPQVPRRENGETGRSKARRSTASRAKDSKKNKAADSMREMRNGQAIGGSSSGRGCDEQQAGKSASIVLEVPPERTQKRRLQSRGLYESVLWSGILQQALPALQEVWESANQAVESALGPSIGSDIVRCIVGGGVMGSRLSHLNEAPFPTSLCNFFIRSFCPPGGIILDPFAGSGTVIQAAIKHGRRALAIEIREEMVELCYARGNEAMETKANV